MAEITSLHIDPELKSRLEAFASLHQQSADRLVNEALKSFLDFKEEEAELVAAADKAWEDFERNGEGVPFDEVGDWLRSWGTENEKAVPKHSREQGWSRSPLLEVE